ncbi:MAG: hypothetical protein R2827_06565, partial [Bdellovibrionales bacterium]
PNQVDRVQSYIEKMTELIDQVELALSETNFKYGKELQGIRKHVQSIEHLLVPSMDQMTDNQLKKLVQSNDNSLEGILVSTKDINNKMNGMSSLLASTLSELWVALRLPIMEHDFFVNVTAETLVSKRRFEGLPERLQMKEIDIYSKYEFLGTTLHFLGEVKFFQQKLEDKTTRWDDLVGNPDKNKIGQIQKMHQLMRAFGESNYEIHLFLISGVTERAKNLLEEMGVYVHGPVFPNQ